MSAISIHIDMVRGITSRLGQNCVKASSVKSGLASMRSNIDSKIQARRSIGPRLTDAFQAANKIENELNRLQSFIHQSLNEYSAAEDYVSHLGPKYGLKDYSRLDSFCAAPAAQSKKHSWWDNVKAGWGAVVASAKKTGSKVKEAFQPGGALYKPFQIGKAAIGIAIGAATVVGSAMSIAATGGLDIPLAAVTIVYGLNSIASGVYDLNKAMKGQYNKMGTYNFLRTQEEKLGETVGAKLGNKKAGRIVGEGLYYVGDIAAIYKGGADAAKNVGKAKQFFNSATRDLSRVRGVRQLKKAANVEHLVSDIKAIRKVSDVSKVRAVQTLQEIQYSKTIKKAYKIMVTEPKRVIMSNFANKKIAFSGVLGINTLIQTPPKVIDKTKQDFGLEPAN